MYSLVKSLAKRLKVNLPSCSPIRRNSLPSGEREFMHTPNAQLPITSVVNFAAMSRQSTGSPLFLTFSTNSSKFFAQSSIRGNISFNLPDVNTGESFILNGRHVLDSNAKRVWNIGSTFKLNYLSLFYFKLFYAIKLFYLAHNLHEYSDILEKIELLYIYIFRYQNIS